MRWIRSILTLLVVAVAATVLTLSGAMAHAGLVSTDPADGSVLPSGPAGMVFTFTEPVTPLVFTLVSPDGQHRSLDGAVGLNSEVRVPLPAGLVRGTHLVSWRVTSADGHPVGGSLVFSVGEPGARPLAAAADPLRSGVIWLVRAGLYIALFLGVGTAVFGAVVAPLPRPLAGLPRYFSLAGLLLAPLALGLQGLDALDVGFSSLLAGAPWATALSTSYGATIFSAIAAFLAAGLSTLVPRGPVRVVLAAAAWLAAALAPMLSGHAGTAQPDWLSRPAVVLHIAGLVFWIGALLPLGWLLRSGDEASLRALQRFSRLVPIAVAPIVLSGVALATLQLGLPGPAWLTPYGLLLAAKLVLLVPLFGLALWNRTALTQPALAGDAPYRHRLRRSIGIELLLVLAVLGVVAGWRFTPPPRVIAELEARPAQTHIHTGAAMADITVTPGRAGESTMRIWLADGNFAALPLQGLGVAMSNPALGVERLLRPATLGGDGFWQVPLLLPTGGTWTVELDLRIDDFKLVKLTGEIELSP